MNEIEQLIQKLFSNQCSEGELNLLFDLIEADNSEESPEVMTALLEQMNQVSTLKSESSDRILKKVMANTTGMKLPSNKQIIRLESRKRFKLVGRVAAASLLIIVTAWFGLYDAGSSVMVQTGFGQQQSIELPDGSTVELNANSSLTFEKNLPPLETRKVWLQGEAFFEVEKKEETHQKFQVITKDLTVEVLGTAFNVNSHQEKTQVFLQEGNVNLRLNGLEQTMLMEPGEIVAYSQSKKEHPEKHRVLRTQHTSWKYGLLLFDNTPLSEVLEKVEEIYGVKIQAKETANFERKLNTGLPIDNLEEAISLLELTLGLEILNEEGNYVIQ